MKLVTLLPLVLLSALVAWYVTRLAMEFAVRRKVLDIPSLRSSHSTPTPRGGGLAFVVVFLLAAAGCASLRLLAPLEFAGLLLGLLIAVVGFWDDCVGLSVRLRLLVQLVATGVALLCLHSGLPLRHAPLSSVWTLLVTGALWFGLVWLVNLTNFMDGIDGIAGTEVATAAAICCVLSISSHGVTVVAVLYAILAAAVVGFLIWNWFPARIFMGDVGSCFLGFSMGVLWLLAMAHQVLAPAVPVILFGVFVIDASMTLLKRMLRRERWLEPHRTHAFQHLSCRFGHERTTLMVAAVNVLWLGPWAAYAQWHPHSGWLCLAGAWLPIVLIVHTLRAGEPDLRHASQDWASVGPGVTARLLRPARLSHLGGGGLIVLYRAMERFGSPVKHAAFLVVNFALVYGCFFVRYDGAIPPAWEGVLPYVALLWAGVQGGVLLVLRSTRSHWRFTSVDEVPGISAVAVIASLLGGCAGAVMGSQHSLDLPRSIYLLDAFFSVGSLVGIRVLTCLLFGYAHRLRHSAQRTRVLVCGADEMGVAIVAELKRRHHGYKIVGFLADRPQIVGATLSGVRVVGHAGEFARLIAKYNVEEVLLSTSRIGGSDALQEMCAIQDVTLRLVGTVLEEQLVPSAPTADVALLRA